MNEIKKILIAYDGSEYSEKAIDDLPRAGLPRLAEALIIYVQEKWLPPPSRYLIVEEAFVSNEIGAAKPVRLKEDPVVIDDDVLLLEKARQKTASLFQDWNVETLYLQGSPASLIKEKADEWEADLILLGSHGNTGNKLFSLGSVSQKIANEANCSVRIVRGNTWKKGAPSRIMIGLDGSETSLNVVKEVASRMWTMGTEVRLITSKDHAVIKHIFPNEEKAIDDWINKFMDDAKEILSFSELIVSGIIKEGDPKTTVIGAADEWGADCIFIGSSDKGSFQKNLLLGSVATAIVSRANCTVEVVRKRNWL